MTDKDRKPDKSLMSDDEFADLMDASFEADGKPVDILSKKRVWDDVVARIEGMEPELLPETRSVKGADPFWKVGLALAACILLSIGIGVIKPLMQPDQSIKGEGTPVPIELQAYVYDEDGETVLFDAAHTIPPATIVPVVRTTQPVVAALLRLEGDGVPEVVIDHQVVAAGEDVGFTSSGTEWFAIEWTGDVREIYCVVAFPTQNELEEELLRLRKDEGFTFDGNCLVLPRVNQ